MCLKKKNDLIFGRNVRGLIKLKKGETKEKTNHWIKKNIKASEVEGAQHNPTQVRRISKLYIPADTVPSAAIVFDLIGLIEFDR